MGAWAYEARADADLSVEEVVERLTRAGQPVTAATIRGIEGGSKKPSRRLLRALAAVYGRPVPGESTVGADKVDTTSVPAALIRALEDQTAAINRLVDWLGTLAPQAIADGVRDALREAGLSPDDGESPDEPPLGQTG